MYVANVGMILYLSIIKAILIKLSDFLEKLLSNNLILRHILPIVKQCIRYHINDS